MERSGKDKRIIIATKNKGKIREIKHFFKDLKNIKWQTYEDFDCFPEVKEGDISFFENAKTKARLISEFTNTATLADDSGLAVDALNGAPGVISSRYAGKNAADSDNRRKLLLGLKKIDNPEMRIARFICNMVLWDPDQGMVASTKGICEGKIGFDERGSGGFGYDCIFIPAGSKKTMAELSQDEKNKISHRGRALKEMKPCLEKYLNLTGI